MHIRKPENQDTSFSNEKQSNEKTKKSEKDVNKVEVRFAEGK